MFEYENREIIEIDEKAASLDQLPKTWQDIAKGSSEYKMSQRQGYVDMARLFLPQTQRGIETLEFYGKDFKAERYPDFTELRQSVEGSDKQIREDIVSMGESVFNEFGFDLPASSYDVLIAPAFRDQPQARTPLRYTENLQNVARPWDSALHAMLRVSPIAMAIQSIGSKHGLVLIHGCGCNHATSRINRSSGQFDYQINSEERDMWVRDFVWTAFSEYAVFPEAPNTKYLIR